MSNQENCGQHYRDGEKQGLQGACQISQVLFSDKVQFKFSFIFHVEL